MPEVRPDGGGEKGEAEGQRHVAPSRRAKAAVLATVPPPRIGCRLVGDDVDVEVGRDGDELLDERFASKERAVHAVQFAGAAHDDLGDAGESRELGDLEGDVVPVDGLHVRAELLGERDVRREPAVLLLTHALGMGAFDEERDQLAAKRLRHARGCPDDAGIGRRRGDAHEDALARIVIAVAHHARGVCQVPHAVGALAQGDLAQGGEVLDGEEVVLRALRLSLAVDEPRLQALEEVGGLYVDELDLVGVVKDAVGDALAHDDAGDGGHHVVQALDMLDVDGGVDVDAGAQEFLDILIPLGVAAARRVGVGELVDEDELRRAHDRRIEIELGEGDAVVLHEFRRHLLEASHKARRRRPLVGFDVAGHHVHAASFRGVGRLQHGIGLAHAGRIAEEDLEMSAPCMLLIAVGIVLDGLEERIGIDAAIGCVTWHETPFLPWVPSAGPQRLLLEQSCARRSVRWTPSLRIGRV